MGPCTHVVKRPGPYTRTARSSVSGPPQRTGGSRPALARSLQPQPQLHLPAVAVDDGARCCDVLGELAAAIQQLPLDARRRERLAQRSQRVLDVEGLAREDVGVHVSAAGERM